MSTELALVGGTFFLLSFAHFVVDWGFQTHAEAVSKSKDSGVRAGHCTVYISGMTPLLYALSSRVPLLWALTLLWFSHFLIDTYIPVYLWAKHIRRMPVFDRTHSNPDTVSFFSKKKLNTETDLDKFQAMARTPLGLFLMISMDQALHLLFLIPIAWVSADPGSYSWWSPLSIAVLGILTILVWYGSRAILREPVASSCIGT